MLTADLVKVRRHKGELRVTPLEGSVRARALELAAGYLGLARAHIGRSREELEQAWADVDVAARDRRLADGLKKLVEDRCEFAAAGAADPEALRRDVFRRATTARRALADDGVFVRADVLAEIAGPRGLSVEDVERTLYADLRAAHALATVEPASAGELVEHYDLSQAQAVLLRAVKVVADVRCRSPGAYRAFFRRLKFLRLLHTIDKVGDGYRIEIDGPYSLFDQVTKYGLQLALALPVLAACDAWTLEADVRWGKLRERCVFRLEGGGGASDAEPLLADDVAALLAGLKADGSWKVAPAHAILDLPGVGVCVPDLVLEKGGTTVYLEVMGYWSRDAVWRRVELARALAGKVPWRILFCVSERLRVSEAALPEDAPGGLYVYKRAMSARAVLERAERLWTGPALA